MLPPLRHGLVSKVTDRVPLELLHRFFIRFSYCVAMNETVLVLITTPECHLCSHAHVVLDALSLKFREIDVDSPEAKELARAGIPLAFMPVLWDGQRVLGYGRLSERKLRRDLGR